MGPPVGLGDGEVGVPPLLQAIPDEKNAISAAMISRRFISIRVRVILCKNCAS